MVEYGSAGAEAAPGAFVDGVVDTYERIAAIHRRRHFATTRWS